MSADIPGKKRLSTATQKDIISLLQAVPFLWTSEQL